VKKAAVLSSSPASAVSISKSKKQSKELVLSSKKNLRESGNNAKDRNSDHYSEQPVQAGTPLKKTKDSFSSKLKKICKTDCPLRLPFIDIDNISADCLLSNERYDPETVIKQLSLSPFSSDFNLDLEDNLILSNLLKLQSFHKQEVDSQPMTLQESEDIAKNLHKLTTTVKTILKI